MSAALTIARKDLLMASRSPQHIASLVLLVLMVIVAFSFAVRLLPAGEYIPGSRDSAATRGALIAAATPGLLWIVLLSASLVVLPRSMSSEVDRRTMDGLLLAPIDEGDVYLGKFVGNLVLLLVGIAEAVLLFIVFLGVEMGARTGYVVLLLCLGGIGLAATGTLLAAATARARFRELLFGVLLVPLTLWTIVLPGIEATSAVLAQQGAPDPFPQVLLLAATDAFTIVLGWVLTEHTLR